MGIYRAFDCLGARVTELFPDPASTLGALTILLILA